MSAPRVPRHTPGPWQAETDRTSWGGPLPPQIKAGEYTLAVVEGREPLYTAGGDRDEAADRARDDANARLIAAAPELLAALEKLLHETSGGMQPCAQFVVDDARAAIAKALGKE